MCESVLAYILQSRDSSLYRNSEQKNKVNHKDTGDIVQTEANLWTNNPAFKQVVWVRKMKAEAPQLPPPFSESKQTSKK